MAEVILPPKAERPILIASCLSKARPLSFQRNTSSLVLCNSHRVAFTIGEKIFFAMPITIFVSIVSTIFKMSAIAISIRQILSVNQILGLFSIKEKENVMVTRFGRID